MTFYHASVTLLILGTYVEEHTVEELSIYTDGGCHGNPGIGGWAYIIVGPEGAESRAGVEAETTNNKMELTGVIKALEAVRDRASRVSIHLKTDSQYVQKGITEWIAGWEKNGWKTAGKKPVKNQELWKQLKTLADMFTIRWDWVQGHAGDKLNELCDTLVQTVIKQYKQDREK